jgi:hypothetical protein
VPIKIQSLKRIRVARHFDAFGLEPKVSSDFLVVFEVPTLPIGLLRLNKLDPPTDILLLALQKFSSPFFRGCPLAAVWFLAFVLVGGLGDGLLSGFYNFRIFCLLYSWRFRGIAKDATL